MKCGVCKREPVQINEWVCSIENGCLIDKDKNEFIIPQYDINMATYIQGIWICNECMDTYKKIYALEYCRNFIYMGNHYYADGRNLKDVGVI